MVLRKHQIRILKQNPHSVLLCWEMRTGKSLPASIMTKQSGDNGIIVCPKALVKDWEELTPFATVYSKEQFKKHWEEIKNPTSLVIDEIHTFGSALFTKKRSQLSTAMYNFIKLYPDLRVWGLSATMIRNDPSSLHTLLCYIGHYIPWKTWRDRFYVLEKRPYLSYLAYFPKPGWQKDIKSVLEKYADIVSLRDCVDYLPPVTKEVVNIKTPKSTEIFEHWTEEHIHEQTKKCDYIKTLGYRKIIIAVHYTTQIDEFKKKLEKERQVFVLDGRTKNQSDVKKQAQEADECYLIVQASMLYGFDGYMFGALVFASMSHKCLDHTQALGRLINLDKPKPLYYYYLIGGKWDKNIYNCIQAGEDFNPHKQYNEINVASTTCNKEQTRS